MARTMAELTANQSPDFLSVVKSLRDRFVAGSQIAHGRATHTTGTAARGEARVVIPPEFPTNKFLEFGKRYPIVLRHANTRPAVLPVPGGGLVFNDDDRTLDGASLSVKFLMPGGDPDGFHDILMNAGRALFVPSARAFLTLIDTPNDQRQALVANGTLDDALLTEGYRSGSFTEFYYHSQIAFEFVDTSGAVQYLKFRAIPADRGPERGLLPQSFQANGFTFKNQWADDERAADYRRRDFEARVRHQKVEYLLQAQLRPAGDRSLLSPMLFWEERQSPWVDVAYLRPTEVLTAEEMHRLNFHVNRTHDSINLPLASTPDDEASIGHARALVYTPAWQARDASLAPHRV